MTDPNPIPEHAREVPLVDRLRGRSFIPGVSYVDQAEAWMAEAADELERRATPEPFYDDGWTTIYHGDALDILPHLSGIGAVVTDPPYSSGGSFRSDRTKGTVEKYTNIGGESGPGHRGLDLDHARNLVHQTERAGIPTFFKQVGGWSPTAGGDELDGRTIKQWPRGVKP